MKNYIVLLFLSLSFLVVDYYQSLYGTGLGIFQPKLPYNYNTDYQKNEGLVIEEDYFLEIFSKRNPGIYTKVKEFLSYPYSNDYLLAQYLSNENDTINLRIIYNSKFPKGEKVKYQ